MKVQIQKQFSFKNEIRPLKVTKFRIDAFKCNISDKWRVSLVFVSRMVDQLLVRMKGKNQDEVRGESVVMPSVTCYANHGFTAFVHLFNQ